MHSFCFFKCFHFGVVWIHKITCSGRKNSWLTETSDLSSMDHSTPGAPTLCKSQGTKLKITAKGNTKPSHQNRLHLVFSSSPMSCETHLQIITQTLHYFILMAKVLSTKVTFWTVKNKSTDCCRVHLKPEEPALHCDMPALNYLSI